MGSCHGKEEIKKDVHTPKTPNNGVRSGPASPNAKSSSIFKSKRNLNIDGIERVSMYSESADSSSSPNLVPKSPSDSNSPTSLEKTMVISTYKPTGMVKPKGHRIRIEPSLNSRPVHLVIPPTPLLVIDTVTKDAMTWGKVHPSMFPPGFKGCEVNSDGWCLLVDAREAEDIVTYWILDTTATTNTSTTTSTSIISIDNNTNDVLIEGPNYTKNKERSSFAPSQ